MPDFDSHGRFTRRHMLRWLSAGGTTLLLAACRRAVAPATLTPTAVAPDATPVPPTATAAATLPPAHEMTPTPAPSATALPAPWAPPGMTRITPNDDFYTLKYNPSPPPEVDGAAYRLVIDGEVETTMTLTLDEIKAFPAVTQMRTLQCISNPVGGNLIGNAMWTGARLGDILDAAGAKPSGRFLELRSLDDYHTGIPIDLARDEDALLVYEMNGVTLPAEHGFPVRCLWPGRYGQKQPKWLSHINLKRTPHVGHWEGQGWSDEALIRPTAIIETPVSRELLPGDFFVGGIANTTSEGLADVAVSLDDGATWTPAELLRGPTPLVWTHWWLRVTDREPGAYRILARATDNGGETQSSPGRNSSLLNDIFPNGTDEMHRVIAQVSVDL